jgi:mxaD protein
MKSNLWAVWLMAVCCVASQAWGADANGLTAGQSIRINAPPQAVWAVVGDFNGTPRWLPLVERSDIVLGTNNRVGAIRLITRRNGTKVTERLLERDAQGMKMSYTYVDGAVMATDYLPVLSVTDAGDGTSIVEWSAHFRRLDYAADPPPAGQDDQSMTDFYNGIYRTGLENLKRVIESGQ